MKKIELKKLRTRIAGFFLLFFFCIFFICFDSSKDVAKNALLSNGTQDDLTVKAALVGKARKLPLYGFNGNTTKGPSWSNKAFRDSVSALHLKVIRYPGGTISSFWEWQKGGFIDDPSLPPKFKGKNTPTTLQDLKLLVDETHCDVIFTLNMITKDLQDQLEMLSSAQSLKIPVKWVELGNEFTNVENVGRTKFSSAEAYGKTCEQWIEAIKSRFPDAKVAVVGGNRNYSADAKNWNNIVLKNAPGADAIVAHLYPTKKNIMDESEINFQKLYEGFVASFNTQGFNSVNRNIWVTEYNINWASDKDDIALQTKADSWSQALATLLMTSITTSVSPNITVVLNHNISGAPVFAAIETQKRTLQKLPNGIGMSSWLEASDNMDSLDKLSFTNDNNQVMQDYQLFGWKFFNSNSSSFLLVNLSNSTIKLNLSNLANSNASFQTKYADKNAVINGAGDVNYKTGTVNNGQVELPAYSITVVKS